MSEPAPIIAYCHSCGSAMNVTSVPPFSNVECPSCGKHTRVKREFGPYTLRRRLAIGGMSVVFTAHDNTLDREVALKILNEDYSADERRITAFEEEARLTASLSHPHVVRVLTTGRAFDRFYIAMEMVAGGHLEHHIREREKIPEAEMLPLAIQVAYGLKAANDAGLIHRDVKPGNILLDAEGNVKIVDFGLALVTQGGKAKATELWATPYYVPPETIEGHPEDFRSDIYAFGATLYHALAGKPSCGEETMATDVLREAKRKVVPLHQLEPGLSVEICQIVDKAMAYEPKNRFSSYDEMIVQLDSAMKRAKLHGSGEIETAGSASRRRAKRKQGERMALAAAAVLVLCAVIAGIAWVIREEPPEEVADTPLAVVAKEPKDLLDVPTDVASRYSDARAAIVAGDFERAVRGFDRLRENAEVQEPSRTWAGIEAVMAAYLNGDSVEARRLANLAAQHASNVQDLDDGIQSSVMPLLPKLAQLPAIPSASIDPSSRDAATAVAWMLSGLKNWEQGMLDEAAAFFRALTHESLGANAEWLSIYQDHARNYLHDHEKLSSDLFADFPKDKVGCDRAVAELEKVLADLKTNGRAKFNVRAWQLDLARHGKLLEQRKPEPKPVDTPPARLEPAAVIAELTKKSAECQFIEAINYLKNLPGELPAETRDSLLALTEAAAVFLADLEADLGDQASPEPVKLKASDELTELSVAENGGLRDASGKSIKWSEVSPDSIIDLHRIFVKNPKSELERLRRHECAISFDWLAGDRERAIAAAARLSSENPAFKRRWDSISAGLPSE